MPNEIVIHDLKSENGNVEALVELRPQGVLEFKYSVITRDNATEFHLSEEWWMNHPDWTMFIRTDQIRDMGDRKCYIGYGGNDFAMLLRYIEIELAIEFGYTDAHGTESETPIDMER